MTRARRKGSGDLSPRLLFVRTDIKRKRGEHHEHTKHIDRQEKAIC
jgi:hypothetical protein